MEKEVVYKGYALYMNERMPIREEADRVILELMGIVTRQHGIDYYKKFDAPAIHSAPSPVEALALAKEITEGKDYDIGVVIGPEGFMYAGLFDMVGFPLNHIHIDEYCTTEDRPYKELDDLSDIKDKRVLLIEGDVNTGRTLEKAKFMLNKHKPRSYALYLGSTTMQRTENVPKGIQPVYAVKACTTVGGARELVEIFLPLVNQYSEIIKD